MKNLPKFDEILTEFLQNFTNFVKICELIRGRRRPSARGCRPGGRGGACRRGEPARLSQAAEKAKAVVRSGGGTRLWPSIETRRHWQAYVRAASSLRKYVDDDRLVGDDYVKKNWRGLMCSGDDDG